MVRRNRLNLNLSLRVAASMILAGLLSPSATYAGGWHHRQKGHLVAVPVGQVQPSTVTAAAFPIAQPAASFTYAMPVAPQTYTYTMTPVQASYTIAAPAAAPAPAATYQIIVPTAAAAPAPLPAATFSTTPTVNITVIEAPKTAAPSAAAPLPAPAAAAPQTVPQAVPLAQQPAIPVAAVAAQQVQLFFVPCHRCTIFCKH